MRKVLIITFYFPPSSNIAALRARGLAKYLPKFGWHPYVLTPKIYSSSIFYESCKIVETPYSPLMKKMKIYFGLQQDENIARVLQKNKYPKLKKFLLNFLIKASLEVLAYPDPMKNWLPFALKYAQEIIKNEKINAIISTAPPATCHIIAHHLKKKFAIPWIADFRDLWVQNHYYPYTRIRKSLEKRLERKIIKNADALVSVSEPLAEKLKSFHNARNVYSITNGFDIDELAPDNFPLNSKFTITYTGNLYEGKRDPSLLLKALSILIQEKNINTEDVDVRFYGPKELWLENLISSYNLNNIVKQYGIFPREVILKIQRESQLLLLLTWNDPAEEGVYTGKIFEYLAARRPILAIGGSKVVIELLKNTNSGIHASNIIELKDILFNTYQQFKNLGYVSYEGKLSAIMKYSHEKMAESFANILSTI